MRLLADENFPRQSVESLRRQGHDVLWARALIERAETDGRLVLTLDKDFWQLALQRRDALRHSGIVLFRVHPAVPENLEPLVVAMLRAEHEWIGHVSTVTADGIEMIPTGSKGH